jgi:hypothetical protein
MGKEPEFTKMICVRLRPETVEALQAKADAERRPLSQYVRIALEEDAARPVDGKKG